MSKDSSTVALWWPRVRRPAGRWQAPEGGSGEGPGVVWRSWLALPFHDTTSGPGSSRGPIMVPGLDVGRVTKLA